MYPYDAVYKFLSACAIKAVILLVTGSIEKYGTMLQSHTYADLSFVIPCGPASIWFLFPVMKLGPPILMNALSESLSCIVPPKNLSRNPVSAIGLKWKGLVGSLKMLQLSGLWFKRYPPLSRPIHRYQHFLYAEKRFLALALPALKFYRIEYQGNIIDHASPTTFFHRWLL